MRKAAIGRLFLWFWDLGGPPAPLAPPPLPRGGRGFVTRRVEAIRAAAALKPLSPRGAKRPACEPPVRRPMSALAPAQGPGRGGWGEGEPQRPLHPDYCTATDSADCTPPPSALYTATTLTLTVASAAANASSAAS